MRLEEEKSGEMTNSEDLPSKPAESQAEAVGFSFLYLSTTPWFERLTGYVAEQKAASYFEQMGHHVEFAPVPNQPVWDMLVDGHPVQIKENLAGVKDFVVQHPEIDTFTDPHIAAAVKDSAVHGLPVLDKDTIHSATHWVEPP